MKGLGTKLSDPSYTPILFSLTPPRSAISPEKLERMTKRRVRRLAPLALDGLGIYDVQQEPGRNSNSRPFAEHRFMDPFLYWKHLKNRCGREGLLFCAPGRLSSQQLRSRLKETESTPIVLVGAPTSKSRVRTTLEEAYKILFNTGPQQLCGGICIPERTNTHRSEARAMLRKIDRGVTFFITQCVYDLPLMSDTLRDYSKLCRNNGISPAKIIFTLSPLDSKRSLEFFRWLGVSIPGAVEERLLGGNNPLDESVAYLKETADNLAAECEELGIPWGYNINIESVISRRNPFLAAVGLGLLLEKGNCRTEQSGSAPLKEQCDDFIFTDRSA